MDRPYIKFYVKDYSGDSKLKKCSLGAQGLWIRVLCECADSPEHGKICRSEYDLAPTTGSESKKDIQLQWMECEQLAMDLVAPLAKFKKCLQELFDREVARIDEKGNIYSSRMVKDHAIANKRKVIGKKGGDATQALNLFSQTLEESESASGKPLNGNSKNLPAYAQADQSLRPMNFIFPDNYAEEFVKDRIWTESLLIGHYIDENELVAKIRLFAVANQRLPHLLVNGKRDREQAKEHFCNWLNKQSVTTSTKKSSIQDVHGKF